MKKWIMAALALLVVGCRSPKQIMMEVPVHDTTYVNHVDSVSITDTVIVERETIVMEADSAMLAEYGLKMRDKERTIMVLRKELERINHSEASKKVDTVTQYKEVPVPVTKYVTVEKELTGWQKFQMRGFWVLAIVVLAFSVWLTRRFWKKIISLIVK